MPSLLTAIVASAALGALVGMIRQWSDQRQKLEEGDYGGVRTFTCWAMLGSAGAYAAEASSPAVLAVIYAVVGVHHVIAKINAPAAVRPGGTTLAASLLTMLVGSLIYWEQGRVALALGATAIAGVVATLLV
jgi:uncharacterized membrane protein (DUF4010 family)